MVKHRKQVDYADRKLGARLPAKALKLGLFATASALVGGLAVAWWYRDTLDKLRNPVVNSNLRESGGFDPDFPDAAQDVLESSEAGILPHITQD